MVVNQETIPGTDTELSKLCDRVLDTRAAVDTAIKEQHAAEAELMEIMITEGKKSIKHEGHTFRLVHQEEKNKIQIKSES